MKKTAEPTKGGCAYSPSLFLKWHDWRWSPFWNSGRRSKYTGDVTARSGWRCYNCGAMVWDVSDEEFNKNPTLLEEE